jgi:DNA-binding MurR/RpiR family transcriptional regulator
VQAYLEDASEGQARIAHYVLKQPDQSRGMPIEGLADAADTSTATVSRFAKNLGYASYRDFQIDLAAALAHPENVTLEDFAPGASPGTILQRVFECNRLSLVETFKVLDHEALVKAAGRIRRARKLVFLGIGGSGLVAQEGAQRFMSLGFDAVAVTDPYEQVFVTSGVGSRDVVFGVSHTGRTGHVVEAAAAARARNAYTVALTNYPQSPLAQACEVALITAFREHRINAAVSSSRIAQICVVDSLYFVVGSRIRESAIGLAEEAEKRVKRMLRHRGSRRGAARKK